MSRLFSHRQSLIRVAIMQTSLAFMAACSGAESVTLPPINIGTVFTIQVANETFKVQASSTTAAAAMRARLASGAPGVIIGALLRGDGGVNGPYGWHLDPATVTPVDVAAPGLSRRTLYRTWARGGRSGFLDAFDCPDPSTTAPAAPRPPRRSKPSPS